MPGLVPESASGSAATGRVSALELALESLIEFTNASCGWVGLLDSATGPKKALSFLTPTACWSLPMPRGLDGPACPSRNCFTRERRSRSGLATAAWHRWAGRRRYLEARKQGWSRAHRAYFLSEARTI